jgi:hypothetical protein
MGNWYNGYSWPERMAKFKDMERRLKARTLAEPAGPCRLCGDPGGSDTFVIFEYHDEDYSVEYSWKEPAAYVLCRDCHIYRVHQRFVHPQAWHAFLAHVRRGGFARETREPSVKAELARYRNSQKNGTTLALRELRPYRQTIGQEWFARLQMDAAVMTDRAARPRP